MQNESAFICSHSTFLNSILICERLNRFFLTMPIIINIKDKYKQSLSFFPHDLYKIEYVYLFEKLFYAYEQVIDYFRWE